MIIGMLFETIDFLTEFVEIFEATIDRRKTHIGNFIEFLQLLHHFFTHGQRLDFAFTGSLQEMFDVVDRRFYGFDTDRTLFQRAQQPCSQFRLIKWLTCAVLFDNARHHQLGNFISSKTFVTRKTLATAAHLVSLGNEAGVDNLGVIGATERTVHVCQSADCKKGGHISTKTLLSGYCLYPVPAELIRPRQVTRPVKFSLINPASCALKAHIKSTHKKCVVLSHYAFSVLTLFAKVKKWL